MVNCAAKEQVANKPMAMSSHRNHIALFLARGFENFVGWITQSELHCDCNAFGTKLVSRFFEIVPVLPHLFGFGQLQPVVISSDPAVSHVHEQEFGAKL